MGEFPLNTEFNIRTDLAAEIKEFKKLSEKDGVLDMSSEQKGIAFREVKITTDEAAEKTGKPKGTYITVDFGGAFSDDDVFTNAAEVIADKIRSLVGSDLAQNAMLVGLGNAALTSDSVGPATLHSVIVTRHLKENLPEIYNKLPLRELSALSPGVLGQTGIETADIIKAVAEKIKPSVVVVIDALASRRAERVCSTVQMSDTGISPGSGVGNDRQEISQKTLGVPVISIGVPTVVDTATLALDTFETVSKNPGNEKYAELFGENGMTYSTVCEALSGASANMIVTPRDIDVLVRKSSKLLSVALNKALHGELSEEDISALLN